MTIQQLLADHVVVPVVKIHQPEHAVPLARALMNAGIGAIEVTLRTPIALEAIQEISNAVPDMTIGAGSIRRVDQIEEVSKAGAQFCVSPGFSSALLQEAENVQLPIVPGVSSASEIIQVMEHGHRLVKFFPAEVNGGVRAINALSAPLPEVQFFPTGGINAANVKDYLALSMVCCVGGSWFVPENALLTGDFQQIEDLAIKALAVCREVE